ncbi:hypothetical protein L596_011491 [Steinernema carpocapsae]|uniref:Uncharacterized protein n=1 Tax=Steinernema carpocapsae TaxID=34508 RepID=A0A4U5NV02_STECR|nr:hypothetical protein L596_011491 [Steinernema carpocapsae]
MSARSRTPKSCLETANNVPRSSFRHVSAPPPVDCPAVQQTRRSSSAPIDSDLSSADAESLATPPKPKLPFTAMIRRFRSLSASEPPFPFISRLLLIRFSLPIVTTEGRTRLLTSFFCR